ncbi:MAG: molybdopterin molybdotransferase MoeA [Candidatus Aminicenantes bacterium]|nr:molybdopterin molybdotransferase MoeA [Candidatus Aminicenantes bacterium]
MISYEEAKKLVLENVVILGKEKISLDKAWGRVAALPVKSKIAVPPFRNSAVDGYAVRSQDTAESQGIVRLKLLAEQPAGEYFRKKLGKGQTLKVMTGAPVPAGADAVVPREEVEERDGWIVIRREIKKGENVREAGEDVQKGQKIIAPGTLLRTPHLGLLAACGCHQVTVYRKPRVAVLITGNELCQPGQPLKPGKIYDSNSTTLKALLRSSGVEIVSLRLVKDNLKTLMAAMKKASEKSDLIITSGGVSVGDYDLVKEAAQKLGAKQIFWKVAQKPAKPLAFYALKKGRRTVWIFGLPGNPGAVMISFEEYVRPFIKKISGRSDFLPEEIEARLTQPVKKKRGRLNFLRVKLNKSDQGWLATPCGPQESGIISSLTKTEGLALIPAEADFLEAGSPVKVHLVEW